MNRDALFGQEVMRQATTFGYRVITVDGSIDIQMQFKAIQQQFRLEDNS